MDDDKYLEQYSTPRTFPKRAPSLSNFAPTVLT